MPTFHIEKKQCSVCKKNCNVTIGDAYLPLFGDEPILCRDCRQKKLHDDIEAHEWEVQERHARGEKRKKEQ
jgi:hypothetical protein